MRWRAINAPGTDAYCQEPYTVQHFTDWLTQFLGDLGHFAVLLVSKRKRMEMARTYNQLMFGAIPTEQIMVFDGDQMRPLRPEERTWPE